MGYVLRFISGKYNGGEFPIDKNIIIIGRHSDSEMVLSENMVSRKHARITVKGRDIILEDLGSTNGTFVNGNKIRKIKLKKGDRILVGTSIAQLLTANSSKKDMKQVAEDGDAITGSLDLIPILEILQLLATSKKTGILEVKDFKVYIESGIFQNAESDNSDGRDALIDLMYLKKGEFHFSPQDIEQYVTSPLNMYFDSLVEEYKNNKNKDDDLDLLDLDDLDDSSNLDLDDLDKSNDDFDLDLDLDDSSELNLDDLDNSNDDFDLDLDDLDEPNKKDDFDLDLDDLDEPSKNKDDFDLDLDLDDLDEPIKNKKDDFDLDLDDLDKPNDDFDLDLDDLDEPNKKDDFDLDLDDLDEPNKKDDFDLDLDDLDEPNKKDDFDLDLDDLDEPIKNKKDDFDLDLDLDDLDEPSKNKDDFDLDLDDLDEPIKPSKDDLDLDDLDEPNKKDDFDLDLDDDLNLDNLSPKEKKIKKEVDIDKHDINSSKLEEIKEEIDETMMMILPLPLFSPLEKLNKDELQILQLVMNFSLVQDVLSNSKFNEAKTYSIINYLLENDYIEED